MFSSIRNFTEITTNNALYSRRLLVLLQQWLWPAAGYTQEFQRSLTLSIRYFLHSSSFLYLSPSRFFPFLLICCPPPDTDVPPSSLYPPMSPSPVFWLPYTFPTVGLALTLSPGVITGSWAALTVGPPSLERVLLPADFLNQVITKPQQLDLESSLASLEWRLILAFLRPQLPSSQARPSQLPTVGPGCQES